MMKRLLPRFLVIGVMVLTLLSGFVTPVSALANARSSESRIGALITLLEPHDVKLSESFIVAGRITDRGGHPIANKSIIFTAGDVYLGQARSDESGNFQRQLKNTLDAGNYILTATFNGTSDYTSTSAVTQLNILPAVVRVQTVPAIAGILFQIDDQQAYSGSDGLATIKIDKAGDYRLNVLLDQYHNPSQRVEFGRWEEESYQPFLDIKVPDDNVIQVGLNVYHQVSQSFVDLDGNPVDPKRITEFMIRSAQGDVFVLTNGQPRWIPASRIARRVTGLEETKLLYSVISVTIDGSNVVNQSQQRFYTHPNENWTISVLLYTLRVGVKDGLFGSEIGKTVSLSFPDGRIETYPLNPAGMTEIHSLARGNYMIEFSGIRGMGTRTPVALSRNQEVVSKVVTYLDMAVVGVLGLLFAAGLLLYGRPWLLHALLKRKQVVAVPVTLETEWALVHETYSDGNQPLIHQTYSQSAAPSNGLQQMRYETVKSLGDEGFEKSTGVNREIFEKMLMFLRNELQNVEMPAKLSAEDELLLTLVFLRRQATAFDLGLTFGITEESVQHTAQSVESALMKSTEFQLPAEALTPLEDTFVEGVLIETPVVESEPFPNPATVTPPVKRRKRNNRKKHS